METEMSKKRHIYRVDNRFGPLKKASGAKYLGYFEFCKDETSGIWQWVWVPVEAFPKDVTEAHWERWELSRLNSKIAA